MRWTRADYASRGCWSRTACCGFTWRSTARPVVTTPLPTLFGARVQPDWIAVPHRRKSSGFGRGRILQDLALVRIGLNIVLALVLVTSPVISAELPVTETIVLVRHGEKP